MKFKTMFSETSVSKEKIDPSSSSTTPRRENKANPNDRTQNTGYTIQKKILKTNPM